MAEVTTEEWMSGKCFTEASTDSVHQSVPGMCAHSLYHRFAQASGVIKLMACDLIKLMAHGAIKLMARGVIMLMAHGVTKLMARGVIMLMAHDLIKLMAPGVIKLMAHGVTKLMAHDLIKLMAHDLIKLMVSSCSQSILALFCFRNSACKTPQGVFEPFSLRNSSDDTHCQPGYNGAVA